ncbi:UDP-N-acetylmuramoyl-tripeptide--D-alanyl-D-alanine ligase [Ichthyenterobacterium magnum]|uniref:UDP-N-acetylmuramoyl-tripeptide--D-alanyl-D-alanine ligase n=1 Tax=Ichthyenterobacterium magnum TaxID=1230530 RepID=A0A420DFG7_9FLAO|nr:UDP-N-acetylmuramoyl-tripeptide--D-alanyl-D-alanine ligase [Ichthyenterobacterium magnum]RKE91013.1 UDP-N-acetylmuramoyl-tripeptide--D-alanyl-D-alanine ligase [Ichthyenterobacterium magnum]
MTIKDIYKHFVKCNGTISTDTRNIEKNSIFFALKGTHFNGNKFAKSALEKGASFSIIDEKEYAINEQYILVKNVLETLQQLSTYHRKKLNIPIIALTGSNGKTTTKELINAVLSTTYKTSATIGNLNNHIGVPLTLLQMSKETEIGIVEMGANHLNEIEFLSNIALPDYGLITNFGKAHLEGFGSIEGVIKGKSELYNYLKTHNKTIFINKNDITQIKQADNYKSIVEFGADSQNKIQIELENSQSYVSVKYDNKIIKSNLIGAYNFNNISVAIAIGKYFNVSTKNITSAIENYTPTNNRSQIINKGSNTIVLDAYNANPTSMIAALENFKNLEATNKSLFLGDMFELGKKAKQEHQDIVNFIESNFSESVYLIGEHFYNTKTDKTFINRFKTFEELKLHIKKAPINDKSILIKGSRVMALERILDLI